MTSRTGLRLYSRSPNHSISRFLCQVCLKLGHTAAICHYKFNKSFITPKAPAAAQPRAYLTEYETELYSQAYSLPSFFDFVEDSMWYADTGATNHVAFGMENLDSATFYFGSELFNSRQW